MASSKRWRTNTHKASRGHIAAGMAEHSIAKTKLSTRIRIWSIVDGRWSGGSIEQCPSALFVLG